MRQLTHTLLLAAAAMLLLAGCGEASQPPVDIDATVEARLAQALTAVPTPTARVVEKTVRVTAAPDIQATVDGRVADELQVQAKIDAAVAKALQAGVTPTPTPAPTATLNPAQIKTIPTPTPSSTSDSQTLAPPTATPSDQESSDEVRWQVDRNGEWSSTGNPPDCGPFEKLFTTFPIETQHLTQFARPGRTGMGGTIYIGHGALRTDNSIHDEVTVRFSAEGFSLAHVSRRFQGDSSEEQIKLEFIHPCGILIRLDHLARLSNRWALIVEEVPVGTDSRITFLPQNVHFVAAGEILSEGVGHAANPYLDFGVYDLREKNNIASYVASDWPDDKGTVDYGICWSTFFGLEIENVLSELPAGSNPLSDYCGK